MKTDTPLLRPIRESANQKRALSPMARKDRRKRPAPMPPGQRLLRALSFAFMLVMVQAFSVPLGKFDQSKIWQQSSAITIEPPFLLAKEITDLEDRIRAASTMDYLRAGVFVVDCDSGRYVDYNGHIPFSAASMIKMPILVSLLAALDRHEIDMSQQLVIRSDLVTGGSGYLQYRPVGTKISVKDTAYLMITMSDNTATNMIIDALGGKETLNKQFRSWGLSETHIANMLGDFDGTNKTSPFEQVYLLARIRKGELISPASRQWMYEIMEKTRVRTLLNVGLAPGAKIAHKTGDIASMVGDAGIVTAPNGSSYIIAVQVERDHRNDRRANLLIRALSKPIYDCFSQIPPCVSCSGPAIHLEETQPVKNTVHRSRHRGTRHHRHRTYSSR
jgi:beta-lactamase class A